MLKMPVNLGWEMKIGVGVNSYVKVLGSFFRKAERKSGVCVCVHPRKLYF